MLNTLAFAVDASCRGQGIGTRMVDVLGLLLKAEAVRATRLHGELDDSVMLVDALEPDFYAKVCHVCVAHAWHVRAQMHGLKYVPCARPAALQPCSPAALQPRAPQPASPV